MTKQNDPKVAGPTVLARASLGPFVTSITGKRVPLALVDAAPELLEALKSMVRVADMETIPANSTLIKAKAAIAKATNE